MWDARIKSQERLSILETKGLPDTASNLGRQSLDDLWNNRGIRQRCHQGRWGSELWHAPPVLYALWHLVLCLSSAVIPLRLLPHPLSSVRNSAVWVYSRLCPASATHCLGDLKQTAPLLWLSFFCKIGPSNPQSIHVYECVCINIYVHICIYYI